MAVYVEIVRTDFLLAIAMILHTSGHQGTQALNTEGQLHQKRYYVS